MSVPSLLKGGFSLFAGTTSLKTQSNETSVNQVGSMVGSSVGTVTLLAGQDARISGSDIVGAAGIQAVAQNITIEGAVNSTQSKFTSEFKQRGVTVSVGNTFTKSAQETYDTVNQTQTIQDDRLKALYDLKAYRSAEKAYQEAKAGNIDKNFTATVGFGSTKQKTEAFTSLTTIRGSSLTAYGDITLIATGSGKLDETGQATDGDLNIFGSSVSGNNVYLSAARDINLQAQANTMDSTTHSSGSSFGFGASIELGKKTGMGYYLEGSNNSGNSTEHSITWTETQISGNNNLTIISGRDTNMIGAQARGNSVNMNIGRNLNLESLQDIETYSEKNKSTGGAISYGAGKGLGGNLSASKGKMDSDYRSVNEQTGIFAGDGGFNIYVEGNTDLKGAVISSEATLDKNKLSAGTLTFSDIENKAQYKATSTGVNYANGADVKVKDQGFTPNMGVPISDQDTSTSQAAISQGTIEIRDQANQKADLSKLSRDVENATKKLDKIFDKKTVQERQELTKMFGEEAFKQIHIISERNGWKEGSPEKIALHAAVGGIMSQLGGGSFTSGAVGAGVNEAVQGELAKRFEKNPDLHQWASFAIGAAAAKLAGGDAQAGGAAAASGTKNNRLAYLSFKDDLKLKVQIVLGTADGEKIYAAIDQALMAMPEATTDDIPLPVNEVAAAQTIKNVLSENGITGEQANQITMYYLQRADDTLAWEGSLYQQGRQASVDLAMNAGLIVVGASELKALYEMGRISYLTYCAQRGIQGTARTTAIADEVKTLAQSPWPQGPVTRGNTIDKELGNNLGRTFPTVDKLENGVLTSTKSVDLAAQTYQTEAGLYNRLKTDIDSLSGFTSGQRNGIRVLPENYNSKVFELALPDATLSAEQFNAINQAKKYAEQMGIGFRIVVVK